MDVETKQFQLQKNDNSVDGTVNDILATSQIQVLSETMSQYQLSESIVDEIHIKLGRNENKYKVTLNTKKDGHPTARIVMKHPSLYSSMQEAIDYK